MKRKEKFYAGSIYHVFNKSISNYNIFGKNEDGQLFIDRLYYYNNSLNLNSFSKFKEKNKNFSCQNLLLSQENSYIKFLAYNIMPDHYHLLIKIIQEKILSKYISDVENSYTRFFNLKNNRKGPLWQSNFKAVKIKNNDQLLHVSRYIHLNPTTNKLINKPEDWKLSSYKDFINNPLVLKKFLKEISINNYLRYKKFVENRIDYQIKLKLIKKLILD